jgi:hypothetical protein
MRQIAKIVSLFGNSSAASVQSRPGVSAGTSKSMRIRHRGYIFDKKITWGLHIETIEAKAFRTFIRVYSLFKSERLSANIKLTLHKALIRSVMTYASPA